MGLVQALSKSTDIYRVRIFDPGTVSKSAKGLGSPPAKFAKIPNRMSPAGIPMFYGAFDVKTAVLETFTTCEKNKEAMAGIFRCTRDLTVLNLSAGRYLPSIFDTEDRHKRTSAKFLIDFIIDFSKPIDREDRAHIDYVPTQVVTEYFRHIFKPDDGTTLDGIIYPSSKKEGNNAIVIFAESNACVEKIEKNNDQALLWLRKISQIDLSSYNKKRTKLS
jgi:RES domain-containing protein